jgi:zinc D-Ala-D-Ala carboxypeptidase
VGGSGLRYRQRCREEVIEMSDKYEHFSDWELRCRCGCGKGVNQMDETFMKKMVKMRKDLGIPMAVTSAYRCPTYNNQVSSTGYSGPHTTGRAIDFKVNTSRDRHRFLQYLYRNFDRIGLGKTFLHVDDLKNSDGFDERVTWNY